MRILPILSIIICFLIIMATPAAADSRRDYIEDKLDYWIDYAEDLDYEVIETEFGTIRSEKSHFYNLPPGEYHAYAEGGRRIDDLDMVASESRGWELDSDHMSDNFPVVSFTLNDWQEVEFELTVFRYNDWADSDYYCLVVSRESDYRNDQRGRNNRRENRNNRWDDRDNRGRRDWDDDYYDDWDDDYYDDWDDDYSRDWNDYSDDWRSWWGDWDDDWSCSWDEGWSRSERRGYVERKLDYLHDFARHRNLVPIMDDIDEIDDSGTYSITLQRGYYVVFAAGGPWIEDLDLHVSWQRGRDICEDIGTDAEPAVWFYLPNRTTVDIELEVWEFDRCHYEDYACILVCGG